MSNTFDFSTLRLPQVEFSPSQREALGRWLPLVVIAVLAWFALRSMRRLFWVAFGLFWAFGGAHSLHHFMH
jgi:hypothetical protein